MSDESVLVFYKGQYDVFNFYSVWPQQRRFWRILHWINFWHLFCFWILGFDLSMILQIITNLGKMDEVIKVFFVLATCLAYTIKTASMKANGSAIVDLFETLHAVHFQPTNPSERVIFEAARNMTRRIRNYYAGISLTALNVLLLSQYFVNVEELPLSMYEPCNMQWRSCFYALYLYQYVALWLSCFVNISFDSLCSSLFIFVKCQLDMLALRLRRLGYDNGAGDTIIKMQLKNCIHYYMKIVQLTANIEDLVYKPISAQIFCSVLVLIANFYAMSLLSDDKISFLKFFIYQCCMLIQIFIICYFASELSQRSQQLSHELYKANWVWWNRSNRKVMLLMMVRFDSPLRIRTINANYAFDLALFSSFLAIWQLPYASSTQQHQRLYRLRFVVLFIMLSILLSFFTIHFLSSIGSLRVIIKVFFIFATELSCLVKFINLKLHSVQNARLTELMQTSRFYPRSVLESLSLSIHERLASKVRNWYAGLSLLAANMVLLTQCLIDSSQLPLAMYEPCNIGKTGCYYSLYTFQYITVSISCWVNICFDSIAVSLLLYVRAQLSILGLRLERVAAAIVPSDNERIKQDLRECIIFHRKILQLKKLVEDFITVPGSVQIFCSVLVLICNFYDMSISSNERANVIKTAVYQTVMLQQIFMICYAANELTLEGEKLSYSLYKSQWQTWNKSNRKICLLLMKRFNAPIHVRTINATYYFSLAAFTSIVNSSYSYFALLKRVNS